MKVIITGAKGKMGGLVAQAVTDAGHEIYALCDGFFDLPIDGNKYKNIADVPFGADVIIDFSFHTAVPAICEYAVKSNTPAVIATTGLTEEELNCVKDASKSVAVFRSGNYSLGIATLVNVVKKVVATFEDADIEIIETHHNRKADAPSGTAEMLFDAVKEARPSVTRVDGRSGMCKRTKDEVGINSIRMGNIVGVHEVKICTENECITLKHEAFDRAMFARGAVKASEFLVNKSPALYDMNDLLQD